MLTSLKNNTSRTLLLQLDKKISKNLFIRIPRFLLNYPKRLRVRKIKKKTDETEQGCVKVFWGGKMQVILPETVSSALYTCDYFEEELTKAIINLLKEGDVFIDIGAHIGYFTLLASHITGDKGKVIAFEPTQSTFEILIRNTTKNHNITCFNNAVFSSEQNLLFNDFRIKIL